MIDFMNQKFSLLFILFLLVVLITNTALAGNIKGKVNLKGARNKAGVLVYIERVDSSFAPYQKPALMDQKNFMFKPKVLPILTGTTVVFMNSDSVLHNVFTPTKCAGSFNLGTWPFGEIRKHTFDKPGCFVTILCNVHPDMQAWIVVLQNPYFIETDSLGNYEIKNIPAGTYTLKVWYPFYKTISTPVTIKDNNTLIKNFTLKRKN